ncbi:hypothetical protein GCM10022280_19350 [Sphingomonas swuensis]|uniref:DUF3047 domain-containing protein n=1 Tax=Sphingomonas swuensis TaxID=977800 RepID=A0ABP7T385_9SPHN
MRFLLALASLAATTPLVAAPPPASAWTVGPIVRGQSVSRGLPLRPRAVAGRAISVEIPGRPGSLHGLTVAPQALGRASLAGARRLVIRYRIEAAPGVRVYPVTDPRLPPLATLYLQRAGDDWSARGPFETFRWYASFATQTLDASNPGERTIVAPLTADWTAIMTSRARSSPAAFRAALAQPFAVGLVLGGGDGLGHGIAATGPARLVVTDFRVE